MAETLKLIPIENASGKQFDRLRRSSRTQGNLDVWVNPYPHYPGKEFFGNFEPSHSYNELRDKSLKDQAQKGPIVIFEDNSMDDLGKNLKESGFKGEALVLPTQRGEVDPNWIGWDDLGKHLALLGIKNITIGGAFLWGHTVSDGGRVRMPGREIKLAKDALEEVKADVMSSGFETHSDIQKWIESGNLPGGAVGLVGLNLLKQGFNPRFSSASARK